MYEIVEGFYHAYFQDDLTADYPVTFETKDGANLKMQPIGMVFLDGNNKKYEMIEEAKGNSPLINGNQIIYPNAFRNIDIKYIYGDHKLKEEIFMTPEARKNLPDPGDYKMNGQNIYLAFITKLDLDGAPNIYGNNEKIKGKSFEGYLPITFRNMRGDIKFTMPRDVAFRDVDRDTLELAKMLDMYKFLIQDKDSYYLISGVKYNELLDMPEGTIVFDPQVVIHANTDGADTYLMYKDGENVRNYNFGIKDIISLWRYGTNSEFRHTRRSLIKFNVHDVLPANTNIISAELTLRCKRILDHPTPTGAFPAQINIHRMLKSWNEGSSNGATNDFASWLNRSSGNPWGHDDAWPGGGCEARVDYEENVSSWITKDDDADGTDFIWDVRDLVQFWINNSASQNHGMLLKLALDQSIKIYQLMDFYSSENTEYSNNRPKLIVDHSVGDIASTYYIRDATGNVIATYKK